MKKPFWVIGVLVLLVFASQADCATIYVDNLDAGFSTSGGTWSTTTHSQQYGTNFRYKTAGTGSYKATWTPTIADAGQYEVYAWWVDNAPAYRATNAPYTINYDGGSQTVLVDQSTNGPGGGKWNYLGTFQFAAGNSGYVQLCNNANQIVIADAVMFESVPTQATPIPGAVWLLGSGFIGLVGLRKQIRK